MSAPKLCGECRHPIGRHSHIVPHECKEDHCGCPTYDRTTLNKETES